MNCSIRHCKRESSYSIAVYDGKDILLCGKCYRDLRVSILSVTIEDFMISGQKEVEASLRDYRDTEEDTVTLDCYHGIEYLSHQNQSLVKNQQDPSSLFSSSVPPNAEHQ